MSTTPRTDAAYFRQGATMYDLARESKKLETELADAKLDAEDQAKWALWYLARAEKAEAELAEMSSIAEKWEDDARRYARNAEYWQSRAEKAEADTARLDWLQSSVSLHVNSIALRGDIRDAIDAAMKEGSK